MSNKSISVKILIVAIVFIAFTQFFAIGYSYFDSLNHNEQGNITIGGWLGIPITTPQEFYDMATSQTSTSDDSFFLQNDLDFTGFTWNYNDDIYNVVFRGSLDGQGYTISNLTITLDSLTYLNVGIFPYMEGGNVSNLNFEDSNISLSSSTLANGDVAAGLIAGELIGGTNNISNITLTDCGVRGSSKRGAGGLVGNISNPTTILNIENVKATGLKVFSTSRNVGGILGDIDANGVTVHISDIDIQGEVSSTFVRSYTGGIVGHISVNSTFTLDRAIVDTTSQNTLETDSAYYLQYTAKHIGGVIGYNRTLGTASMTDVFYTGELVPELTKNSSYVGVAAGRDDGSVNITNSYYSQVLFRNPSNGSLTYTAPSTIYGTMMPLVNASSMPSSSWWDSFAVSYYAANSLWAQDPSTGRLYLIR